MSATDDQVVVALTEYRNHIAAHNRRALEIYVPFAENSNPSDDMGLDDEEIAEARMDFMEHLVGDVRGQDGLETPRDVLSRYDELVPSLGLDGTLSLPENNEESMRKQDEFFSAIEDTLKARSLEEVRDSIEFPRQLGTLAKQVGGLSGAGLPGSQNVDRVPFWWGLSETQEQYAARVKGPADFKDIVGLSGWEIAGGWESGSGQDADCWVLYCRKSKNDPWGWRYAVDMRDMGLEIFDTVPELLRWYKSFREPDLSRIPEYNESDVFSGTI
ncbi:putative Knr4/Smi1-like domain-containing protein [Seiridium cardinale]